MVIVFCVFQVHLKVSADFYEEMQKLESIIDRFDNKFIDEQVSIKNYKKVNTSCYVTLVINSITVKEFPFTYYCAVFIRSCVAEFGRLCG